MTSNDILVNFYTYFDEGDRADYSAVAYMLTDSCKKYPDYITMSQKCGDLYGCSLSNFIDHFGACRTISLSISAIDSRFALEGENMEKEAAELLLECLLAPRAENGAFSTELLETAKQTLYANAIGRINDRAGYARMQADRVAFEGEAYGTPLEGEPEDVLRVTPESAYAAYQKMLKHSYIDIRAIGYSSFDDTLELFRNAFSKLERGEVHTPFTQPSVLKAEPAYSSDSLPMQQSIVRMYLKNPNMCDRAANALLAALLGGTTTSRFFTKIREKQSLCYYCSCASRRHLRTMVINAGVAPTNVDKLTAAVLAEIKDISENGVSEEELELTKIHEIEELRSFNDNPRAVSMWHSTDLLNETFYSIEELIEEYSKVTPKRIQEACKGFVLDTVFTLMPKEADDDK